MSSKNKKEIRICWITASYMLQVDLPLLSNLNEEFDIDWYYWGADGTKSAETANDYANHHHLRLKFISPTHWIFNPLLALEERKILKKLKETDYDIYYFDVSTFPWLLWNIKTILPKEKVVIAMHHGKPHAGMRFKPLYFPFLRILNSQDFNLQYFSKTQGEAFCGKNTDKKFLIPLALNDFGESKASPTTGLVTFTSFGNIIPTKNVELLIEVANRLWEKYPSKFKVRIVGHCRIWETKFQPLIHHEEAFDLDIRRIGEEEIADLFGTSNYLVLPYKSVTQSGPLRIAYGYNIPVIASNLDGFKESIEEGVTGLLFETENADSLFKVMEKCILDHPRQFEKLKGAQKEYVENELSVENVCNSYSKMFHKIIENK